MKESIEELVRSAVRDAIASGQVTLEEVPDPAVERPRDPEHGDWATAVALRSAKDAGMPPRELAELVATQIADHPDIESVEVAGPGFINLRLSPAALQRILRDSRESGREFGRLDLGGGRRVQVEFVSANPVGPMHVGHGRWAALGDSMARVLEHAGWRVEREFYINDAGVQMEIFAKSVAARYLELCGEDVTFEPDWYQGAYITEIAREIHAEEGDRWCDADAGERQEHFREKAYTQVLGHLERVLHEMGVDFDVWFSERTLHETLPHAERTSIDRTIAELRDAGHVYDHEGATWFRSKAYGDDKDRVLTKSDGEHTYFAADIAYHKDKFDRGFDRVIDVWGADHHGYVPRMKAAVAALGHEGQLDVVIGQLVNLFRGGEAIRMSKRTGEMVTLEDLLDEVGPDAARYFFLRRSTDQPVDFDIELAREQSSDNPIYYVQYAHARICSILRKVAGVEEADAAGDAENAEDADSLAASAVRPDAQLELLTEPAELALMRKLGEFPEVVEASAADLAPYKLTRYAEELAASFHQFYTVCRVIDPAEPELTAARLYAVDATRGALKMVLDLIGVGAPERM